MVKHSQIMDKDKEMKSKMVKPNIKTKINKATSLTLATIMLGSTLSPVTVLANSNGGTRTREMRATSSREAGVSIENKIPDENLKKVIREKLGVSVITDKNILNLRELYADSKNIKDITGINYAKNLESLRLPHNLVTNLGPKTLEGLIKLETLNLGDNKLVHIDPLAFSGLTNLVFLHLDVNPLTTLDPAIFNGLTELRFLYLNYNQLTNLDPAIFNGLTNLLTIKLDNNQLTNIDFSKNLSLTETRDLSHQQLQLKMSKRVCELPSISNNPKFLKENEADKYKIKGNKIILDDDYVGKEIKIKFTTEDIGKDEGKDKPEYGFSGTITIDTSHVIPPKAEFSIEDKIPDENLKNVIREKLGISKITNKNILRLIQLEVYNENIKDITGISYARNLNFLNLRECPLTKLESTTFKGLVNLQAIYLNKNQLITIEPTTFNDLTNLKYLKLDENQLTNLDPKIFQGLVNLKVLDLSNNQLTNIDPKIFGGLVNLQRLYLYNNQLAKLDQTSFKDLTNLQILSLDNNKLTDISPTIFDDLINLQELGLSGNRLAKLDPKTIKGLTNLQGLSLARNKLTTLDSSTFKGLTNLQELSLSENKLTDIDLTTFSDLIHLRELYLSYNQLTNINPATFSSLTNLQQLGLYDNEITNINPKTFKGLTNLRYLNLGCNKLANIDISTFKDIINLQELDLIGNQLTNIDFLNGLNLTKNKRLNSQQIHLKMLKRDVELPAISNNPQFVKENDADKYKIDGNKIILNDDYVGKEIKVKFTTDDIGKYQGKDKPEDGFSGTITIDTSEVEPAEVSIEDKIPDENLKKAIREKLGVAKITDKNILKLIELDVNKELNTPDSEKISTIVGINYAKNLQKLNLDGNNLTDLNPSTFNGMTNLQILSLQGNKLKKLDSKTFEGSANLQTLDLRNNQLTDIGFETFKGLTNLQKLYLSYNQLTTLDPKTFEGLANLQKLSLSKNELANLDSAIFQGLINLRSLDIDNNQLTNLDIKTFEGLKNLQSLRLEYNKLVNIDFLNGLNLTKTKCFSNQQIQLKMLEKVQELPIISNNPKFVKLNESDKYKIEGNKITLDDDYTGKEIKIKFTTDDIGKEFGEKDKSKGFSGTITIDTSEVSIEDKIPDENLKQAIREKLGVSKITDKNILNLTYLDANNKDIKDLTGINYAQNLTGLILYNNKLTKLEPQTFKGLRKLDSLHLGKNQLNSIDPAVFKDLTNLHGLYLNDNQLTNIDFTKDLKLVNTKTLQNQQIHLKMLKRVYELPITNSNPKFVKSNDIDKYTIEGNKIILDNDYVGDKIQVKFTTDDVGKYMGNSGSEYGFSGTITIDTSEVKPAESEKFNPEVKEEPMKIKPGEDVDLTKQIKNLPDGAKVEVITPINPDKEGRQEGKVKITFPDGSSKEYTIPVTIVKPQSEKFNPTFKTDTVRVIKGESVDLKAMLTNKPDDATVTVVKDIDTATSGTKTGRIKVVFGDGTSKEYDVTVKVELKTDAELFIPKFSEEKLRVKPNEKVDLTKRLINLPEGAKVTEIQPITTDSTGIKTGKIKVTFSDKSEKEYEVKVDLEIKQQAEYFEPEINTDITRTKPGDEIDLGSKITNLPENAKVKVTQKVNSNKEGKQTGKVEITFPDGSTNEYTIPVEVEIKKQAEYFEPEIDKNPIKITPGEKIDLTKKITNLPDGATVKDITDPAIDTTKSGTHTGKVEITYKDGSKKVIEIPVNVELKKQAEYIEPEIDQEVSKVKPGEGIDLAKKIKNLPVGSQVKVAKPIDPNKEGKQVGQVEITFPDGSTKTIDVPVEVEIKKQAEYFEPEIDTNPTKVKPGEESNLKDRIKNLPVGSEIKVIKPIDTSKAGHQEGKVKITFPDGSSKEYTIPVDVVIKKQAEDFEPEINQDPIKVNPGESVDITKQIKNLPEGSKVEIITPIDPDKEGKQDIKVKITFPDKSSKEYTIPITVTKPQADKIKELEKQVSDAKETENTLRGKITELEANIAALEKEKTEDSKALNKQINDLKEEKAAIEAKLEGNAEVINGLNRQIKSLQGQVTKGGKDNEELKSKIADLETSIKTLTTENTESKEKLATATEKISNLEARINDLSGQVGKLTNDLNTKIEEIKTLNNTITDLKEQKAKLEIEKTKDKEAYEKDKAELETKLQETKDALASKEAELIKANRDFNEIKDKLAAEEAKNAGLEEQVKSKDAKILSAEKQLENLKAELDKVEDDNKAEKERLENLISEKTSEIETLKSEKSELDKQLEVEKTKNENLEKQVTDLTDKLKKANGELSDAKDKITELEKQLSAEQEKNKSLTEKVAELEGQVSEAKATEKALREQISELTSKIATLEKEKSEGSSISNEEITKLKEEKAALESKLEGSAEVIKGLKEQIKDLKDQTTKSEKDKEELKTKIANLEKQLGTLIKENTDSKEKLAAATEKITNLEAQVKDLEGQLQGLNEEINKKAEEIKTLNQNITGLKEQIAKLEIEKEKDKAQYEKDKAELETNLQEARDNLAKKEEELSGIKGQLEGVKKELSDEKSKTAGLTEQVKAKDEKITDLGKQIEDLKAKLEKAGTDHKAEKERLEKLINKKTEELEALKTEKTELEKQILVEKTKNENLEKQVTDLTDKLNKANEDLSKATDKITVLEKQLAVEQEKNKSLTEKIESLEKQVSEAETTEKTLRERVTELTTKIETLEKEKSEGSKVSNEEITKLKEEKAVLETKLEGSAELIKELRGEIKGLKGQVAKSEKDNGELKEKIAGLEAKIESLTTGNTSLKEKLATSTEKISNLVAKNKELEDMVNDLTEKNKDLGNQITNANNKNKELEDKIANLESEKKDLEDKLEIEKSKDNSDPEKIKDLEGKIKDKDKDIKDLTSGKKLLEDEIIKLKEERDKLNKIIKELNKKLQNAPSKPSKEYKPEKSDNKDIKTPESRDNGWFSSSRYNYRSNGYVGEYKETPKYEGTKEYNPFYSLYSHLSVRDIKLKYVFTIGSSTYQKIYGDSVEYKQMDVKPYLKDNRTMLPLRYVAEAIGSEVTWDNSTRTAYFKKNGLVARIQIDGSKIELPNGKVFEMDSKPDNVNGHILVSITNVAKVFNLTNGNTKDSINQNIEWDNDNKTITVNP